MATWASGLPGRSINSCRAWPNDDATQQPSHPEAYFERFDDSYATPSSPKSKSGGCLRIKKIALIVSVNSERKDPSAEWYETHQDKPPKAS